MKRKQRRDHQTAPAESGRALKQEKQKHGVGRVQQDVHDVRSDGAQAEKIAVELMGHPGQWVPVGLIARAESPFHVCPRQALGYVSVIGDVVNVVIIEELIVNN